MTRLKLARLQKGWTQVALAFYSRVPVAEISRIEGGRVSKPYAGHVQRLAEVLGLAQNELLDEVGSEVSIHPPGTLQEAANAHIE